MPRLHCEVDRPRQIGAQDYERLHCCTRMRGTLREPYSNSRHLLVLIVPTPHRAAALETHAPKPPIDAPGPHLVSPASQYATPGIREGHRPAQRWVVGVSHPRHGKQRGRARQGLDERGERCVRDVVSGLTVVHPGKRCSQINSVRVGQLQEPALGSRQPVGRPRVLLEESARSPRRGTVMPQCPCDSG